LQSVFPEVPTKDIRLSPVEFSIIEMYRKLDSHSKELIYSILEKECNRYVNLTDIATATETINILKEEPAHLMPVAAHNDFADDEEEQRLMQEDLDEL
jgi:hypothetical protein